MTAKRLASTYKRKTPWFFDFNLSTVASAPPAPVPKPGASFSQTLSSSIQRMLTKFAITFLGLFLITTLLAGCGGDDRFATAQGTLTVDGKPIKGLEIVFEPQFSGGAPSIGFSDERGHYQAIFTADRPGIMIGKHIIRISGVQYGEGSTTVLAKIPPEYGTQSTQEVEITRGTNTVDIDVKTKP